MAVALSLACLISIAIPGASAVMLEYEMAVRELIRTQTAEFWLDDDGIVRYVYLSPDVAVTIAVMMANMEAVAKVSNSRKRPLYADIRLVRLIDRESRRYGAGEEVSAYCSAVAIHVGSSLTRTIGNFFMAINKPPYPTRLFTSESEAINWLKTFVVDEG